MNKKYKIFLDGQEIGTTRLEKADAPMGVVFGRIEPNIQNFGYKMIQEYCISNEIEITADYPDDKFIATMSIEALRVRKMDGTEIKGIGNQINGMDRDGFEITILGVPYPFYEEEFPHHVKRYKEMFEE